MSLILSYHKNPQAQVQKLFRTDSVTPPLAINKRVAGELSLSNENEEHIAFKVHTKETTTSAQYLVSPDSGRIVPGGRIFITSQLRSSCIIEVSTEDLTEMEKGKTLKDDFIIQSTVVPINRHALKQYDIWKYIEVNKRLDSDVVVHDFSVEIREGENQGCEMKFGLSNSTRQEELLSNQNGAPYTPQERKEVIFEPERVIYFRRPLTRPISRSLKITNLRPCSIAFILRATLPQLYFARPKSGRIEPGKSIHIIIEKRQLVEEPPLDEICQHKFQVSVAAVLSEHRQLSEEDVVLRAEENQGPYSHKFQVKYLPAQGLTPKESEEYEAGMACSIPEDLVSIHPRAALCFNRPLTDPSNLSSYLTITNIYSSPIAFKLKTTAPDMYSLGHVLGKLDCGECLKIKVTRKPVEMEPLLHENCEDLLCVQSTVIESDQESLEWKAVEKKEDTIYTSILQVMFIPFDGPTAKQKVIIRESSWEPHPHLLDFDPGEAQDNEEKERKYEESAQNEETRQKLASERNKSNILKWQLAIEGDGSEL